MPAAGTLEAMSTRLTAPAVTPIAFVQAMMAAYERRGMDPAGALAQAQIAPSSLLDVAFRISARQMERISGAAMQELDDEALGAFSRRLPWGAATACWRAPRSARPIWAWRSGAGAATTRC